MYKILMIGVVLAVCSAPALADTAPPPPPTEIYTAPDVQTCNPLSFSVYFKNGEAVLTDNARNALRATAKTLQGCAIARVDMTPISKDGRSAIETEQLSENRVAMVKSALSDKGLLSETISVQTEPATYEVPGTKPMARRVDIHLAAYRPDIG